jgi:hypothetical protein
VRIRIALSTAVAVTLIPVLLFTIFSSSPAASAKAVRHSAVRHVASGHHRSTPARMKLMSYAQAQKVSKLVTFYDAVTAQQEENYLEEIAYLKALGAQKQQQAAKLAAERAAAAKRVAAKPVAAAPAVAVAAAPVAAPVAAGGSDATSTATADWACIREHESGDNYAEYNGGAYQFELGTWEGLTGLSTPAEDSPPAVQDAAALRLFAERGWEPWTTRFVCGL